MKVEENEMQDLNEYKEKLQGFLKEHYTLQELKDLSKHFDFLPDSEEKTEGKEQLIQQLLKKVFDLGYAYAFFCVLKQFKKYHKDGIDSLIEEGSLWVPVPEEMIRPKFEDDSEDNNGQDSQRKSREMETNETDIQLKDREMQSNEEQTSPDLKRLFKHKLKAIVIGVGKDVYNRDNGSCCVRDAEAVAEFLKSQYGLPESDITLLTGYVSGKEAMAQLKKFCEKITYSNNVLFYFSGYGMERSGNSYLMTSDSYVHNTTVRNALRVITVYDLISKCKARVKLCVFDANHCGQRLEELPPSGKIQEEAINEMLDGLPGGPHMPEKVRKQMIQEILQEGNGVITFASCDSTEKAYESKRLQHGYFTWCLLQGIQEEHARRNNQNISLEDLKIFTTGQVIEKMQNSDLMQTPQYQCEMNGIFYME